MPQKVILDLDPGIDDAIALCLALYNPDVEVVGITSVAGKVPSWLSARNLQALIEFLDPPKLPRIGFGDDPEGTAPVIESPWFGPDGLGGLPLPTAARCKSAPAEKVISDLIHLYPNEISIMAMGPLTNIARAFQRDKEIPLLVNRLFMVGGTWDKCGNVLPCSEFNMYCDAKSAQYVFRSPCTKTLVPLDVTTQVKFPLDVFQRLPSIKSRFGQFLHELFRAAFHYYRYEFGREQIFLHEPVAWFTLVAPDLFEMQDAAGDVESTGVLTQGMTVFDRRPLATWQENMEVATVISPIEVYEHICNDLTAAADCVSDDGPQLPQQPAKK
ncbi:MAG: nucleoside hydrolase [Planctomycetia bacterium]|nr:nucleoside hydrolase [Planctomycetia bacterium]